MRNIKTNLELEQLINEERSEFKCIIDLNKDAIDITATNFISESSITIPYMEELAPYKRTVSDFIMTYDLDIPHHMSANHYIKSNNLFNQFCEFRLEQAITAFKSWLNTNDIVLQMI